MASKSNHVSDLLDLLSLRSLQAGVPISEIAKELAASVEADIQRGYKVEEAEEKLKILKGLIR